MTSQMPGNQPPSLARLIWLSIAAAVVTIGLKLLAWGLTSSAGLLSDALESVVNLFAAFFALVVVHWAARPADEEHAYGHEKADYLAAAVESLLILGAAATIGYLAVQRLLHPVQLSHIGLGVAVSAAASVINLVVARTLIGEGKRQRSIVLEADGRHLMTDVWTSAGVIVGVIGVGLTGWKQLDPLVALAVAGNVVVTGILLMRRFTGGLMDRALPPNEQAIVEEVLDRFRDDDVRFHALRTRRAGRRAFISVHILVPGGWSVQRAHDVAERVDAELRDALQHATVFTHLEPVEDPRSFLDAALDREDQPPGE
ncbi:MAG TPA: cation diffusion facilitator family transporter [Actinomycetota bacterium]|nr:cation diffusion facilitator family transporter [Actinomycetota bacterium]